MTLLCLALMVLAFGVSAPLTYFVRGFSRSAKAFDSPGVAGQVKERPRLVPNTGGIAIFAALTLPILAGLVLINAAPQTLTTIFPPLEPHLEGIRARSPLATMLIACLALLHVMGLIDDRRPLGPFLKLGIMLIPALGVPLVTTLAPNFSETRLVTAIDPFVGGAWLSIIITAVWLLVITNAMNFMDNMDGLSGGVALVAAGCFLVATLVQEQWLVAACLATLIGAVGGFLVFNAPPASIFMGDGGSLVVGFMLGFLTVRTTYFAPDNSTPDDSGAWYGVLMPLIVLAVPLYDLCTVVIIRLRQGRSPFVGDMQHLSHRLVKLGLSRPRAVVIICGTTAITGLSGIFLGKSTPAQAILIGVQTLLMLIMLALFEFNIKAAAERTGQAALPADPAPGREPGHEPVPPRTAPHATGVKP